MITPERVDALQHFGYNALEARFLCMAAFQSGYFLRRQFLAFIGGTKGWKDVAFLNRLKANRHCRIFVYGHNVMLYHLSAKPIYIALGDKDNRNRREHQPSTIKNKLMGLDYVLQNPFHNYLATEREKLDYFTRALPIPPDSLPTRWFESPRKRPATPKYFVEKYPLYIATASQNSCPVPHFGYVDEGLQTTDRFRTFLEQYGRLLTALPDFRIIYIAEHPRLFESARRQFEGFSKTFGQPDCTHDPRRRDLLDYFEARHAYEARDFSHFDTASLIRYREAKKHFAGEPFETLFHRWRANGTGALWADLHPDQFGRQAPVERFSTYVLSHSYDLFGTLTSASARQSSRSLVAARVQKETP